MNQILSVETYKKEKKSKSYGGYKAPVEIEKVIKFFVVSLIIFGILMISSGSYSMYKDTQTANNALPKINITDISEKQIALNVSHKKGLKKVTYKWNNGDETELNVSGKKSVQETIEIPTGENTLNVTATDVNGKEAKFQKRYSVLGDISIEIEAEGNNLKISAIGKEKISYMTYRWDDEDETKLDVNATQTEQIVEIPRGLHTLTVICVDINNNTETKEQQVNGVTKPKLEVTQGEEGNFVINASDEEGLKKVEFTINETDSYKLDLDRAFENIDDRKEFEFKYQLNEGHNKVEVTVYNESGVSTTVEEEFDN